MIQESTARSSCPAYRQEVVGYEYITFFGEPTLPWATEHLA